MNEQQLSLNLLKPVANGDVIKHDGMLHSDVAALIAEGILVGRTESGPHLFPERFFGGLRKVAAVAVAAAAINATVVGGLYRDEVQEMGERSLERATEETADLLTGLLFEQREPVHVPESQETSEPVVLYHSDPEG